MALKPAFGAQGLAFAVGQRRVEAKHGVGLFIHQFGHRPDAIRLQLATNRLRQQTNVVVQCARVEMKIVERHQILDTLDLKWNSDSDANRADWQEFDDALQVYRAK